MARGSSRNIASVRSARFPIGGFAAKSVGLSAASAILLRAAADFCLYDDFSPMHLVCIEAGTSSFCSARQQPVTLNLESSQLNAGNAALHWTDQIETTERKYNAV